MSNGFVSWYQSAWSAAGARRWVEDLENAGWMLVHPRSGKITIVDLEGQQVPVTRDWVVDALALEDRSHLLTNWWLDDQDSDADHGVHRLPQGGVAHTVFLDGISDHASRIGRDLLPLVMSPDRPTVGLIFDRNGRSEDMNWDAIMAGADVPITVAPDLLVLTAELDRLHPDLPGEHRTLHVNGWVIHDWNDEYPDFPDPTGRARNSADGR